MVKTDHQCHLDMTSLIGFCWVTGEQHRDQASPIFVYYTYSICIYSKQNSHAPGPCGEQYLVYYNSECYREAYIWYFV